MTFDTTTPDWLELDRRARLASLHPDADRAAAAAGGARRRRLAAARRRPAHPRRHLVVVGELHGHDHPRLNAALRDAGGRLEQVIFAGFTHEPAARLAARARRRSLPAGLPARLLLRRRLDGGRGRD